MSEEGDSWLKSAFGFDIEQAMPRAGGGGLAFAGPPPAGVALLRQVLGSAAVSEAAPVVAGAAAAVGLAGGAAIAVGVGVGVAAPLVVGYLIEHGKELDEQGDPEEQSWPGGVPPDLSPDGGVIDDPTGGWTSEPNLPLPERPTEPGPAFDPTLPAPMDPAPDFTNPVIPRFPRVPEFPPEVLPDAPEMPPDPTAEE